MMVNDGGIKMFDHFSLPRPPEACVSASLGKQLDPHEWPNLGNKLGTTNTASVEELPRPPEAGLATVVEKARRLEHVLNAVVQSLTTDDEFWEEHCDFYCPVFQSRQLLRDALGNDVVGGEEMAEAMTTAANVLGDWPWFVAQKGHML